MDEDRHWTPFRVGLLLVQRVPSSSVVYRAMHTRWHGYLYPEMAPTKFLERVGKLIDVQSKDELDAECQLYRSRMKPGKDRRLAYYEVIDADA